MKYLFVSILCTFFMSCLWDRDTLADEIANRPNAWEIISGQFPSHSQLYYQQRIQQITKNKNYMKKGSLVNDLATAYIRTNKYPQAEELLNTLLQKHPKKYTYNSNMAVLKKKQSQFAEALPYIRTALAVKPEGHMGIGDWYKKMLKWRAQEGVPQASFIGSSYELPLGKDGAPGSYNKRPNNRHMFRLYQQLNSLSRRISIKKRTLWKQRYRTILTLLKNDQHFNDGFFIAGECALHLGDLNIAAYAYIKAIELQHPRSELIRERLKILSLPQPDAEYSDEHLTKFIETRRTHFQLSEKWVTSFHQEEDRLLNKRKYARSLFNRVQKNISQKGVVKYVPLANAHRKHTFDTLIKNGRDALIAGHTTKAMELFAQSRSHALLIGPESQEMAIYLNNIAVILSQQKEFAHSETHLLHAITIYKGYPHQQKENIAKAYRNLASIARFQKKKKLYTEYSASAKKWEKYTSEF